MSGSMENLTEETVTSCYVCVYEGIQCVSIHEVRDSPERIQKREKFIILSDQSLVWGGGWGWRSCCMA